MVFEDVAGKDETRVGAERELLAQVGLELGDGRDTPVVGDVDGLVDVHPCALYDYLHLSVVCLIVRCDCVCFCYLFCF